MGKGKAKYPLPHPDFPMIIILLLWVFYGPHRCPHCEDIPDDVWPWQPYSVDDPDPPSRL